MDFFFLSIFMGTLITNNLLPTKLHTLENPGVESGGIYMPRPLFFLKREGTAFSRFSFSDPLQNNSFSFF